MTEQFLLATKYIVRDTVTNTKLGHEECSDLGFWDHILLVFAINSD